MNIPKALLLLTCEPIVAIIQRFALNDYKLFFDQFATHHRRTREKDNGANRRACFSLAKHLTAAPKVICFVDSGFEKGFAHTQGTPRCWARRRIGWRRLQFHLLWCSRCRWSHHSVCRRVFFLLHPKYCLGKTGVSCLLPHLLHQ